MEALFKKYFWVLNLLVLAVAASLVAKTGVDYLATRYLTVQPEPIQLAATETQLSLLEKADDENLSEELTIRSPFNVEEKDGKTDKNCTKKCDGKACGDDGCGGTCGDCADGQTCTLEGQCENADGGPQESELNIKLVGTVVNPMDPAMRFAQVLLEGSQNELIAIDDDILSKATVVDILPKMLLLREGEKLTHVGLWSDKSGSKGSKANKSRVRPRVTSRPSPSASARPSSSRGKKKKYNYAEGVKKAGDFDYQIDKQMLDEQLTDLTQLGMQARVIPNYRKGKYEGFKLVGVRPGSLYRAIGIRSGDIVRSINGKAINSPNKAMELFTQLKNASNIALEVERRGKIETFNYTIQ